MKLRDCDLNLHSIALAPFVRSEPEECWVRAKDHGLIPQSLFDLYKRANYLSFGTAPTFLKDGDGVLFSYFSLIVRSLMLSLLEAEDQLKELNEASSNTYYPGKRLDDPSWTSEKSEIAAKRANDAFRNILMALHTGLDALSELIAIFSQGKIKKLQLGLSQFSRIENWLKDEYLQSSVIASPQDMYLSNLHTLLRPIIHSPSPEVDWLPYMRLLRNKALHLGHGPFRSFALVGNDGKHYTFIPREWPYIWEKYMRHIDNQQPTVSMQELLVKTLAHQDIIEYAHGATRKVFEVIKETVNLTAKAYTEFSDFAFNQVALDELSSNSKEFSFEHFV